MLPYIYHVTGIIENIAYMQEFIDAFEDQIVPEERYRFEQYLKLMEKALAIGDSRNPLGNLNTFLDITAVFAMLCDAHNELAVKYDRDKKFDIIKPILNCASGKNRSGAAMFHYRVLSRTADMINVGLIPELLDEKYHTLRCAIGDEIARTDISHEDTLGASGTRKKKRG
ncbi:MAG: hypothetical protein K0R24_3 [Gammaproteobacteria bacterium]|jgi:hypothetical protein|nr:hypothetical protein [Gammaproteobacteria bacterium]